LIALRTWKLSSQPTLGGKKLIKVFQKCVAVTVLLVNRDVSKQLLTSPRYALCPLPSHLNLQLALVLSSIALFSHPWLLITNTTCMVREAAAMSASKKPRPLMPVRSQSITTNRFTTAPLRSSLGSTVRFNLPSEKELDLENETKVELEPVKNPLQETYSKEPEHRRALFRKMKDTEYLTGTQYW